MVFGCSGSTCKAFVSRTRENHRGTDAAGCLQSRQIGRLGPSGADIAGQQCFQLARRRAAPGHPHREGRRSAVRTAFRGGQANRQRNRRMAHHRHRVGHCQPVKIGTCRHAVDRRRIEFPPGARTDGNRRRYYDIVAIKEQLPSPVSHGLHRQRLRHVLGCSSAILPPHWRGHSAPPCPASPALFQVSGEKSQRPQHLERFISAGAVGRVVLGPCENMPEQANFFGEHRTDMPFRRARSQNRVSTATRNVDRSSGAGGVKSCAAPHHTAMNCCCQRIISVVADH